MTTTPQRRAIAATIAALDARGRAHRARAARDAATDPAEKAHHDREAAAAEDKARQLLTQAKTDATSAGATDYAETLGAIADRMVPTDPTADPEATPDPLRQAADAIHEEAMRIGESLAPLFQHLCEHLSGALHDNSAHDPADQHGHEIYAVHVDLDRASDDSETPVRMVGAKVVHLRTHEGDVLELLTNPAAALQLAQVHPTQIVAVVSEGRAHRADDDPDAAPLDCRAVVIATPMGLHTSARMWDANTRTWGEPAHRWNDNGHIPDENLPQAVAAFYAVEMIAAHVLAEAPEPDDD